MTRIRAIPTVPALLFIDGPHTGLDVSVGRPVVVGRDPGAADVVLDRDPQVSRRHAAFAPAGAGLTIRDLGSTNGTFVNGEPVTRTQPLSNRDRVMLGSSEIEVRLFGQTVFEPSAEEFAPLPSLAVSREATAVALPALVPPGAGAPANDIVVQGLVKQFGSYRAVDGIDLHVYPGEIYGFLGPNGAGKSTTVHMLTTLLPPTGGVARIAGHDIVRDAAEVRRTIGAALQAAALDPDLSAWEHMALQTALQGLPRTERKRRASDLLDRVKLTGVADRRVGGYSGGMKRRLDLALALVHEPKVLFLDEPTTGLDPQSRSDIWEEVARLVRDEGTTLFLTTQYLEEADILADRVGIIDHGEIVAEDTPAALKEQIGRPTIEVVPVDPNDWVAFSGVLEQFGELSNAAHKGVAVRLTRGVEDLANVIRALDAAGLALANFELHAPTLDDVFLAKTGRPLEEAAAENGQPDRQPAA
jgi:ABC-2 type transport system ATP-binding protein